MPLFDCFAVKIFPFIQTLHPKHSFNISRARKTEAHNVILAIEVDGFVGFGEASPDAFYSETADDVVKRLRELKDVFADLRVDSVEGIEESWQRVWPRIAPSRATQCAIDIALWDLVAKKKKVSVTQLALKQNPREILSSFTIGLSAPEELREKVEAVKSFPAIKLKMDPCGLLNPGRFVYGI